MNKKSLLAIERIISCINELKIITKNKNEEYFYNNYEMIVLLDLINEIESNLNKVSQKIKNKYQNIDWNIIKNEKHYDDVFGESINIGKAWILSSQTLEKNLLENLIEVLEKEIPVYYKKLDNKNK